MSAHELYFLDGPAKGKSSISDRLPASLTQSIPYRFVYREEKKPTLVEYIDHLPYINSYSFAEYVIIHTEKTDFGYTHDLKQLNTLVR